MNKGLERSAKGEQRTLFPLKSIKIVYSALLNHFATYFPFEAPEAMPGNRHQEKSVDRSSKANCMKFSDTFSSPICEVSIAHLVWETNFKCHSHQNTIIFSIK